jgi:hypothetical protein
MTSQEFGTSWIRTGVPVIVYTKNRQLSEARPRKTTIKRVAGKSFTVEWQNLRFNTERLDTPRSGGSFGWSYSVTPVGSELARDLLAADQVLQAIAHARTAVDRWTKTRSREDRLAAIAALQAIEEN